MMQFLTWLANLPQDRAGGILKRMAKRFTVTNRTAAAGQSREPAAKRDSSSLSCVFGQPRQLEPVSRAWGFDRGLPIDRYYIQDFLTQYAADIRGRVLEIGDETYTRKFGGDRVTKADVLSVEPENPRATFVADLTQAGHIPSDAFDCVILTQTLDLIYDVRAALATLQRILKPGGVLLATFPGITRISHDEWAGSWYWGFTSNSARRMFGESFSSVQIHSYGNVLAASAFLYGFAVEEMQREELDYRDRDYELIVGVRAAKRQEREDEH